MRPNCRFYSRKAQPVRFATALTCLAVALAGCAQFELGVPVSLGDRRAADVEATGSIARRPATVAAAAPVRLADADWEVAQTAIRDAIDRRGKTTVPWINPETGVMGTVALSSAPPASRGCSGFDLTVLKGDSAERLKGEACRGRDGGLRIGGLQAYAAP